MNNSTYLINEIKKLVTEKNSAAKIYLYGSRVKGTAKQDSDWDILILLNTDKITPEIENEITSPLFDLEIETGEVISPMIYAEYEWNTKYEITPFYKNIMKEGQLL
jgi:uncharacterized protein